MTNKRQRTHLRRTRERKRGKKCFPHRLLRRFVSAMEGMDALYTKLQVYLTKKDNDCGNLRFLTSRTTDENSKNIDEICARIRELLRSCDIPTDEEASPEDPRCVQAFKYLALNTSFESQENLTEDPLNGHLVDMCPPLSPYLLIEILWSLRYEDIVAKSILHVPLDLAVELIEISKRCLNLLDFSRGLDFLTSMTLNCYRKLRLIDARGALTTRPIESLERLMIYCQELMTTYFDAKFTRLNEVADVKRSERHGFILKRILKLTRDCLDCAKRGVSVSDVEANVYKITYGREPHKRMNDNFSTQLGTLDQEFVHNLLKKLTDIEVGTYIDWASLEDAGNSSLSLQKSLGIDCYNFIEFIRDRENLIKLDKLVECLQQISSKPDTGACSELDIEQLRRGLLEGKRECLKELVKHYREWNHEIFALVRNNRAYLDKDDFPNLLEYLTYVMTKDGQEDHKRDVYATVTRVLLQLDVKNVYETLVGYILKHDARNILESPLTEDTFKRFMAHNKNFKSSTNLRLVLFYLAKNPRKILSILVKMTIGHPAYENVMISPSDLALLSPIMSIREKRDESLAIATLRQVCLEADEWSAKKFMHLVRVMLDECVVRHDDIVDKVFVPCLNEATPHPANVRTVLNCLREIVPRCDEARLDALLIAIARRMSRTRGDLAMPKYSIVQSIGLMIRVFDIAYPKIARSLDARERAELVERMERSLGPVDRHHFAKFLLDDASGKIDIHETLRDYERRCLIALMRIRRPCESKEPDEDVVLDFQPERFRDDYLRHLVLTSTENEYVKFALEATVLHCDSLRCKDEYAAYEKITRATIEACVLCLEFPQSCAPDSFASLLKSLARFTSGLTSLENVRRHDLIEDSLVGNFRKLDEHVKRTSLSTIYTSFMVEVNNRDKRESSEEKLRELVRLVLHFGNKCLDEATLRHEGDTTNEAQRYKIAHEFVTDITSLDYVDENNSAIWRIYKLLSSSETND